MSTINTGLSNDDKGYINSRLLSGWQSLKSNALAFDKLSAAENEIEQYFHKLHEYLRIEQHKLLKPIINNKETIQNIIENEIKKIKILINNNLSQQEEEEEEEEKEKDNYNEDTSVFYTFQSIISSINESESLDSFLKNKYSYSDYNQYNSKQPSDQDVYPLDEYKIKIKNVDFNQLSSIINQSIKVSLASEDINKKSYIFTSHKKKGATLINTSDNYSVEELNLGLDFNYTLQSMVMVGEHIYIFGSQTNQNKWFRFSIKSKSIDYQGDIVGIEVDCQMSVCYDGKDYIYLVNGFLKKSIDRFNIKTMQFERYYKLQGYREQLSTMIYNNVLYSIPFNHNKLIEFEISNKTLLEHRLDIEPFSACHDDNGNFYIHSLGDKFVRINVLTKQTETLKTISNKLTSIHYHQVSPSESYIFSLSGHLFSNFAYSIETNQTKPFFDNDKYDRRECGSASISI